MEKTQKVALISGASRGIGSATAQELGRRGYHVVVNYRSSTEEAEAVARSVKSAGGSAQAEQADVCDAEEVRALVERVRYDCGRIDALVCNANTVDPPFSPLDELSWPDFISKVTGELAGAFFLTQRVLPLMQEQKGGRIVYVSSTAADSLGSVAAHSTAKAALNTYSRHVAAFAAQHGVVVNTVAFAAVATDATSGVLQDDLRAFLESRSALGRVLEPRDAASSIAAVADEGFGAAVGQVIRVDGGFDVLDQQLHPMMRYFE